MSETDDRPLGRRNYETFADRYAAKALDKPHNAYLERPATLTLLPELAGRHVLDAGCGPGFCSEIMAHRGASVTAMDVTPRMVELARERLAGLDATVLEGDVAGALPFGDSAFDIVLCSLVLDYVADLAPVFLEFRRLLVPGGTLVFSLEHPIMGCKTWDTGRYFDTEFREIPWGGFGEPRPVIAGYRRPLTAILNPLLDAEFRLDRAVEPEPLEALREMDPQQFQEMSTFPCFLCVRAIAV